MPGFILSVLSAEEVNPEPEFDAESDSDPTDDQDTGGDNATHREQNEILEKQRMFISPIFALDDN